MLGAVPAAAAQPGSLVSACSGVSLPPSVVTNILSPVLTGIVSPIQTTINPVLGLPIIGGAVGLPPLSINVTGLLATAASGAPIGLSVLNTSGAVVGSADQCNSTADSIQLDTPAGISIGGNRITGLGANNQDAVAGEIGSIAFGNNASTTAAATNAVAIGSGATVTAANSVALGAGSTATRGATAGSVGEVSVGAPGAERQITNVAPGALTPGSTDAVNGAQLAATNTNVSANTTNIAGNTASIAGNTTNIANLNSGVAGIVRQVGGAPGTGRITVGAETAGNVVDLTGTAGTRTLTGVSPGAVTAVSTDAVNGAQLSSTNAAVVTNTTNIAANTANIAGNTANIAANTTLIAGNTTSINALNNGTAGLVQQAGGAPGNGPITVGALTGGTSVSFAGTGGTRVLSGVSAGVAATDAVNVSQLGAVGAVAANAVSYDLDALGNRTNRVTLAGGAAGPVTVTNVAPGTVAADSTDAVNGAQLFATNGQVTTNTNNIAGNTTAITSLTTNIANGTIGLVRQVGGAPGAGVVTVGAATGGTRVDVSGTGGTRIVGGVTAGVATTDAVNVGQLNALGTTVANSVQYDTVGGVRTNTVTLVGGAAGPVTVTNVAPAALTANSTDAVNGGQLFATNTQVATNTTNIAGNTTAITNLSSSIANGTTGLVQQAGGAPGNGQITVGAATGGTSVSVAGAGGNRVVTGVAAGLAANDAATVGQLGQVVGGAFNAVQYDTDANGGRLDSVTLIGGTGAPVRVGNVAAGTVAAGSLDAVNGGQLAATNAGVAGNTVAIANNTTTINAVVNGQAGAFRSNNAAGAAAPSATGANATAGGFGASASGARGVALGNGAVSTGVNSVSLGAGSSDGGVANVVSVGSVGGERRITNLGAGVSGTDAVNLAQLQAAQAQFGATAGGLQSQIDTLNFDIGRVRRNSNAATAGAMAVAALPQAFSPGAGMIGGGIGNWRGQYAFALGASKIIGDQTVVKAGVSYNTRGSGGFNAGVGYQF